MYTLNVRGYRQYALSLDSYVNPGDLEAGHENGKNKTIEMWLGKFTLLYPFYPS